MLGDTTVFATIKSPGYYRVVTTIVWGGAAVPNGWSGYVSGWRQWAPNSNADFSCAHNASRCANYGTSYGAMYVSG